METSKLYVIKFSTGMEICSFMYHKTDLSHFQHITIVIMRDPQNSFVSIEITYITYSLPTTYERFIVKFKFKSNINLI